MQDLKTGHLLGASPRAQFHGQLVGSSVSIIVTTAAYSLYTKAYMIPGPSFPAPAAYLWLSLARLLRAFSSYIFSRVLMCILTDGIGNGRLPPQCGVSMIVFAALFTLISLWKTIATRRQHSCAKWIPSGVAFAIGFLNTPSFSLARLIGGIAEHLYRARIATDGSRDIRLIVVASGFVLGEGVMSVVCLLLRIWGFGAVTCWGCSHGLCSGCPAQ
jgi:uncharacterized oligopeptide transporter (OPT) family protein